MERAAGGGVELRLGNEERALLMGLAAELRALLDGAPDDPSLRRLFPPAYDDEADERGYRELTGDSLLDGRREALELLSRTADRQQLTAQEADAWLRVEYTGGRSPVARSLGLEEFDFGVYQGWAPLEEVNDLYEHRV